MTDAKKVRELIAKLATEKGPDYVITDEDISAIIKEATPAERGGLFNKLFSGAGTPAATNPNDLSQLAEVFETALKPLQDEISSLKSENQKLSETQKAIVEGQKSQEELALISKVKSTIQTLIAEGKIATEEGIFGDTPDKHGKYTAALLRDYDFMSAELSSRPAKTYDNTKKQEDKPGGTEDKAVVINPLMSGVPEKFAEYAQKALNK